MCPYLHIALDCGNEGHSNVVQMPANEIEEAAREWRAGQGLRVSKLFCFRLNCFSPLPSIVWEGSIYTYPKRKINNTLKEGNTEAGLEPSLKFESPGPFPSGPIALRSAMADSDGIRDWFVGKVVDGFLCNHFRAGSHHDCTVHSYPSY